MPTTSSTYRFRDKRCSCHATTLRYFTVVNGLTCGVDAGYASHKPHALAGVIGFYYLKKLRPTECAYYISVLASK